jgi:hypothetical protein
MEPNDENLPTRRESLLPALAVTAVAAVAVAAAVMVQRVETKVQRDVALDAARPAPAASRAIVTAPPLKPPATQLMGGSAACKQCGVVEMVVAVQAAGQKEPRGYQMHIRMDDGTLRVIEQRGALAAGSRVTVDGSTVKAMP